MAETDAKPTKAEAKKAKQEREQLDKIKVPGLLINPPAAPEPEPAK
jgi:hypothetical protein